MALKDVADAHSGLGVLAEETSLNREGLYTMLSEEGNPTLSSLALIIDALGMKLEVVPKLHGTGAA